MKDMEINAVVHQKVSIDPKDAVENIKKQLGFGQERGSNVFEQDGILMHSEYIIYHGYPHYKYTEVSNNPNWVALFQSIKCLEDYYQHSNDPKWLRHIDAENQEVPVMGDMICKT